MSRADRAAGGPPPSGIPDWALESAAAAPRISPADAAPLIAIFREASAARDAARDRPPPEPPGRPVSSGRTIDPKRGSLYMPHLRATDGHCERCEAHGKRVVDHCHEHGAVRGLICYGCNRLADGSMGDLYRARCPWCAWDAWLAREAAS